MREYLWMPIDTETTGVSFLKSQVIQLGVIFCDEKCHEISRHEWNINYEPADYEWTDGAEAVHGIPVEEALDHGVDREDFIDEFETALKNAYGNAAPSKIIGVGVQSYFDYLMTQNSIYEPFDKKFPVSYKMLGDLSCIGHHSIGESALDAQLNHFGIECDNSMRHSALYDAEMHMKLFRKLIGEL